MNLKYCLMVMLLFSLKVFSQEIKPLSIGDTVPVNALHFFPALKNKLIILDFMATNCISCLEALPRFDSIQKQYRDKVEILLVTYEKKDRVKKFLQYHPSLKLAMTGEDTILTKYFPHVYISHEVWIKDGIVIGATYAARVNNENVSAVVNNLPVSLPLKQDITAEEYTAPFLIPNPESVIARDNSAVLFYSTFSTAGKNIPPNYFIDSSSPSIKITAFNFPVTGLYLRSYGIQSFLPSHITADDKEILSKKNTASYEAVLPAGLSPEERGNKIRNDLDCYLKVSGRMEKRNVPCYVLKIISADTNFLLKAEPKTIQKGWRTISLKSLLFLANQFTGKPYLDESGLQQKLYVEGDRDAFTSHEKIQNLLKNYGLTFFEEMREQEMLVLKRGQIN